MPGLYINEDRGILLKAALMLLPEQYRLSHVPFRVNTRKGPYDDVVYGTVAFGGMMRAWSKYFPLVTLELEVSIVPADWQPCILEWDKEEFIEIKFEPRLVKITTRKSQGGAWLFE